MRRQTVRQVKERMSQRHCLALDLQDDPELIAEYRRYHDDVWPEIIETIRESGIENMEIYLLGNRMFMIMDTVDDFSFEDKARLDADNPAVQKWEQLMWTFQKALPQAKPGEKWLAMERIFTL